MMNSKDPADKNFTEIMSKLNKWTQDFSAVDDIISFFQEKGKSKEWEQFLKEVVRPFVEKQHKKLLPTLDRLIERSSYITGLIGDEKQFEIAMQQPSLILDYCVDFLKKRSIFYKQINTSGLGTFDSTRRARHIVNYIVDSNITILLKLIGIMQNIVDIKKRGQISQEERKNIK